ncbi:MAG: hypothetical protein FJZ01_07995 [Candidatus Sericytochromatia bacterium]|nr:hypothetical protein [Candidatus Tanganyikabacteria bacterium]
MGDSADVLNKISLAANAFAQALGRATAPPGGPQPYGAQPYYAPQAIPGAPVARDNVAWGTLAPPPAPAAPAPQTGGVMNTLSAIWQSILDFFRRLFRSVTTGNPAAAPAMPGTAYPSVNQDARAQAFQMFPTGSGLALGFVPVSSQRYGNQIVVSATGFGQARVYWEGNQLFFQQNSSRPQRVDRMTSTRLPSGDARFDIFLEGGKTVSSDLLADGRSIRYQGYTVTLA